MAEHETCSPGQINLIEGTHTLPNVPRDFPEWHRGRAPYVLWALDVDQPAVKALAARAAQHLDGLLLAGYRRQPHITLDLCGFPSAEPALPDEFSIARIDAQCAALRAARVLPFEVGIGGLASFSSAPFLSVGDPAGNIAALRRALAPEPQHWPEGGYRPHVTVGLYAGAWLRGEVSERLNAYPPGDAMSCCIERLSLMGYAPAEIGGPLTVMADFWLATGVMRWREPLPSLRPSR